MANISALIGKELRAYFFSPIAYLLVTGFLVMSAWLFLTLLRAFPVYASQAKQANDTEFLKMLNVNDFIVAPLVENMTVLLIVFAPLMTMRLFAEEKREGTDQLLYTSPITVAQMIAGKFLSSLIMLAVLLAPASLFVLTLAQYSNVELGPMYSAFGGLAVVAVIFAAIGLFTSSVTENQIVAAVGAFLIELGFFTVGWATTVIDNYTVGWVLEFLSLREHQANLIQGVIYSRDIAYFVSIIVLWLFLAARSVESARWR